MLNTIVARRNPNVQNRETLELGQTGVWVSDRAKKAKRLKSEHFSSDFRCQTSLDHFRYKKKNIYKTV